MANKNTDLGNTSGRADDVVEERTPAGEDQGQSASFRLPEIARAFSVAHERVGRAMAGEFDLDQEAAVNSKQAQQLAEVLLGDQPLDQREAALMVLGAYTPRSDDSWGLGDKQPGDQSERLKDSEHRDDRAKLGTDAADIDS